jgi:hypothetical protein
VSDHVAPGEHSYELATVSTSYNDVRLIMLDSRV